MSDTNGKVDSSAESIVDKRVMEALRTAQASAAKVRNRLSEPLAIVGIGCRFPGAENPDAYWELLTEGRCSVTETPGDRKRPTTTSASKMTHERKGAFLENVDQFDAAFFGIAPREAAAMDPQQRLLLEVTWEALEDAAVDPQQLRKSRTGVFVGICSSDYWGQLGAHSDGEIDAYWGTGNAHGVSAGRLSYLMDWRGPCTAIDTACSSSLTALHFASRSLRYGDCDTALVAGVNLMLNPELTLSFDQAGMLSPTGQCHTFSSSADGFVRGEGCGAVLVKRLSKAQADGDRIYCVIRGSAVNQDGKSIGLTAPNGIAQQAVIRQALADARVKPDDVDYVEAHGTGTPLGDPIEVGALTEIFAKGSQRQTPLRIGSAKTNVGHLEGAAGMAGLIKLCLSMDRKVIPAHLNFDAPSSHIDWSVPIEVNTKTTDWRRPSGTRIAGLSSFGFGGTNAHVVLEESPVLVHDSNVSDTSLDDQEEYLLAISAKSTNALKILAARYADALESLTRQDELGSFCATANAGRSHFDHRLVVRGTSSKSIATELRSFVNQRPSPACLSGTKASDVKVGWQFRNSGNVDAVKLRRLFDVSPAFAVSFRLHCRMFDSMASENDEQLFSKVIECLDGPDSLAVHFCTQLAAADQWRAWGASPDHVWADGDGDYAAACVAGMIEPEDAVAEIRGRVKAIKSGGPVASVLEGCSLKVPVLEYRSARNGDSVQDADGRSVWIHIGGQLAVTLGTKTSPDHSTPKTVHQTRNECLAQLEVAGVSLCWRVICSGFNRSDKLPLYPFERQRHWYDAIKDSTNDSKISQHSTLGIESIHPLLGGRLDLAGEEIVFQTDLSRIDFLEDHQIGSTPVLPMSGFLELAVAAGKHATGHATMVADLEIEKSLTLPAGQTCCVQVIVTPDNDSYRCRMLVRKPDAWELLATCRLVDIGNDVIEPIARSMPNQFGTSVNPDETYAKYRERGLHHGPRFRVLRELFQGDAEAWGHLNAEVAGPMGGYFLHPAVLDGCLQVVGAAMDQNLAGSWLPVKVSRYQLMRNDGWGNDEQQQDLCVHVRSCDHQEHESHFDLDVRDKSDQVVAMIRGLVLKPAPTPVAGPANGTALSTGLDSELLASIANADHDQQHQLVEEYLLESVADIMGLDVGSLGRDKPLDHLGMDSMMAFEIQQSLQEDLGVEIGMEQFMQGLTFQSLTELLVSSINQGTSQADGHQGADDDEASPPSSQRFVEGAL